MVLQLQAVTVNTTEECVQSLSPLRSVHGAVATGTVVIATQDHQKTFWAPGQNKCMGPHSSDKAVKGLMAPCHPNDIEKAITCARGGDKEPKDPHGIDKGLYQAMPVKKS